MDEADLRSSSRQRRLARRACQSCSVEQLGVSRYLPRDGTRIRGRSSGICRAPCRRSRSRPPDRESRAPQHGFGIGSRRWCHRALSSSSSRQITIVELVELWTRSSPLRLAPRCASRRKQANSRIEDGQSAGLEYLARRRLVSAIRRCRQDRDRRRGRDRLPLHGPGNGRWRRRLGAAPAPARSCR